MTDEWSLKDKKKQRVVFRTNETQTVDCVDCEHIETMHQKLIEDIDVIDCTENSKLEKWEIIEEVLAIIDKRFGMKE